jgi:hypothetical protein
MWVQGRVYQYNRMLWSKIINLLNMPSDNETQIGLFGLNDATKPFVKIIEDHRILSCQEVEEYYQFDREVSWILMGMTPEDYENPLYDILEEEEPLSDYDIEYAEHCTDYDY